jgi:uncharacterized protein YukE
MSGIGDFVHVLGLIWERRAALVTLLEKVPDAMHDTGAGMEAAGQGAIEAGRALKGGTGVTTSALDALEAAAQALSECRNQVQSVAAYLEDAGKDIGDVKVPTVSATYVNIGTQKVVSGLSFGDTKLFGDVSKALKDGAGKLEDTADGLASAVTALQSLKQALSDTGGDLNTVGEKLKEGGQALQAV